MDPALRHLANTTLSPRLNEQLVAEIDKLERCIADVLAYAEWYATQPQDLRVKVALDVVVRFLTEENP